MWVAIRKRPVWPLVVPMVLVTVVAVLALIGKLRQFVAQGDALLATVAGGLLALAIWMLVEAALAIRARRHA